MSGCMRGVEGVVLAILVLFAAGTGAAASVEDGYYHPDPGPGETVSNQIVGFMTLNISADGNTDTFFVHVDEEIAPNMSLNQVSVDGASISSSGEIVDGRDNDTVHDTVRFGISPDGSAAVDVNASVDLTVAYPNASAMYPVNVTVEDSNFGTVSSHVTTIAIGNTNSDDSTSDSDSTTEDDSNNDESTSDSDSTTEDDSNSDETDSDSSTGTEDTAEKDEERTDIQPHIRKGGYTPTPVASNQVSSQDVWFSVANISADGNTDIFFIRFPDAVANTMTLKDIDVRGASISSSAERIDGNDSDSVKDTIRFAISPDAATPVDVNVTTTLTATYPEEGEEYPIHVRIDDSREGTFTAVPVEVVPQNAPPSDTQPPADENSSPDDIPPPESGTAENNSTSENPAANNSVSETMNEIASDVANIPDRVVKFFTNLF